ncbi:MAG: polysaccharide biosynthesis tyrosine autokinase [Duncaniella sp.]|nr:polysaccharide biosynthesis tyrosine autokinase [Duncaniella sp.]
MANIRRKSESIDIKGILRSYVSKWYLFVITISCCLVLGYLYTRKHTRDMAVRANILISQDDDGPFGMSSGKGSSTGIGALFGSNANVQDEVFVISSHSLYRNVAKDLEINKMHYVSPGFLRSYLAYPDFPVDVVAPGVADTLRKAIVFKIKVDKEGLADINVKVKKKTLADLSDVKLPTVIKTEYGDFTVTPTEAYPKGKKVKTTVVFSGYESAAEALTSQVDASLASKKSNVITLAFDTPNSEYGSAILNKILEKYNERGIYEKNLQGQKTATFLEDRIRIMGADLNEAEMAIQNYKEANGITDLEAEAIYQTDKRSELEKSILSLETELELLTITREFFVDSIHNTELVPTTVSTAAVQSGIGTYNSLVMERLELLNNAKTDNYALRKIDRRMELTRNNILATTDRAIEASKVRLKDMLQQQQANRSKLGRIPTQEREYVNMARQQEMKQELYLFLLQRQEENAMLLANSVPKGKIVDEAFVLNEPLGVSNKVILFVFFFIGLIIPPIYLYIRKLILDKVESREEAERHLSAPILGEMCVDRSGRSLVVTEHDTSSATELFRLLRSNMQFLLSRSGDKVVLMTSTKSGEGKSFISLNLAASLALQHDKKVLLVGMDIRNPQLANYLNINPKWGLTNYLSSGNLSIQDIIVPVPGAKSLDVIVAGPIPPNPAELLMSDSVDKLFETLRPMYDYIIIDSAPVGMVSDTFTLDRLADATVYVTRINYTTLEDLKFVESVYEDKRLKNLSVVINGTHSRKGYGYGYSAKNAAK